MNSGNYHVTVNTEAGAYEFDLVKTDTPHAALTFGGIKYSIIAADPLKQSTINKIINSADIQNAGTVREFAGRLKHVSSVRDVKVSTTEKAHGVAASIIARKPLEDLFTLEQERQFSVEHGLRPGVPVPGINTEKPMTIGERMKDLGVPGASITVINNGRIAWSKNYGVMDSPEASSQAASISKVVTALATLSIIKQCQINPATLLNGRKIDLNTPISTCLDAALLSHIDPKGLCKEITIQHLLQHTSGIVLRDKLSESMTGFQGYPRSADELDKEIKELEEQVKSRAASELLEDALEDAQKRLEFMKMNREKILSGDLPSIDDILLGKENANSGSIRAEVPPNTRCRYSGANTLILQKILEVVSGKPFDQLVQENVFGPLGLSAQSTYHPDTARLVRGYEIDSKPVAGDCHVYPELAVAGLSTTSADLGRVAIEIQNALAGKPGTIIDQTLAKKMVTLHELQGGPPCGVGVFVERFNNNTYFIHPGSNRGFQNFFIGNNHGQGVVIMTNSDNGKMLYEEILKSVAAVYNWQDAYKLGPLRPKLVNKIGGVEEISTPPPDKAKWVRQFEGTYKSERGLGFTVSFSNGAVIGQLEGEDPFTILPLGPATAVFRRYDPGPYDILKFVKNNDGLIGVEIIGEDFTKHRS